MTDVISETGPGQSDAFAKGKQTPLRDVLAGAGGQRSMFEIAYNRERLRVIGAELNLITAYRIEADSAFAHLSETGAPVLSLGKSIGLTASIEIESATGALVLFEGGEAANCAFITDSEERLIDHVMSLYSGIGDLTPRTMAAAADILVGRTIEDVERTLVLRTMLHYSGNHKQVAFALGITECQLRIKLGYYFGLKPRTLASPEDVQ